MEIEAKLPNEKAKVAHRKSESHCIVRRLVEKASSWRVQVASLGSTQVSASEASAGSTDKE